MRRFNLFGRRSRRHCGQPMAEMIILIALILAATVFLVFALPDAFSHYYGGVRDVIAAPF